jgi:hypothetical protein
MNGSSHALRTASTAGLRGGAIISHIAIRQELTMRKAIWISAAGALACIGALASAPAAAYTSVGVHIGVPVHVAPAPIHVAPPVYPVYQYGNGAGYYYEQPRWVGRGDRWDHRRGGDYRHGGWPRRDLDHDGIPNRYDRDRDGDGVRNRFDRAPSNPYYR